MTPEPYRCFSGYWAEGNEFAFGSRFINGGSIFDSNWQRTFLSRVGTLLANVLLGTGMYDMTSGFQGFHASIVEKFLRYPLLSKAHFYQTELRYLLRHTVTSLESPILLSKTFAKRLKRRRSSNSLEVLWHYFLLCLTLKFRAANIQ